MARWIPGGIPIEKLTSDTPKVKMVDCPSCGGTGRRVVSFYDEQCTVCAGMGFRIPPRERRRAVAPALTGEAAEKAFAKIKKETLHDVL